VEREFKSCEFVEGPAIQGSDPEGIFASHLNFVGYTNISKIFVAQEIKENKSPESVISTNVKNMKNDKSKVRQRPKGKSPSKVSTRPNYPSRPSSSSRKMSLGKKHNYWRE